MCAISRVCLDKYHQPLFFFEIFQGYVFRKNIICDFYYKKTQTTKIGSFLHF